MMQGDSYKLEIELRNEGGEIIAPSYVSDVEIAVGHLIKTYASGMVSYADGKWIFPLTQEETFGMLPAVVKVQARILWLSGNVEGVELGRFRVFESISKVVMG